VGPTDNCAQQARLSPSEPTGVGTVVYQGEADPGAQSKCVVIATVGPGGHVKPAHVEQPVLMSTSQVAPASYVLPRPCCTDQPPGYPSTVYASGAPKPRRHRTQPAHSVTPAGRRKNCASRPTWSRAWATASKPGCPGHPGLHLVPRSTGHLGRGQPKGSAMACSLRLRPGSGDEVVGNAWYVFLVVAIA